MRRLWAYIITVLSTFLIVGATFSSIFLNMESNAEYQSGRELVFRISDKDGGEFDEDAKPSEEIAEVMEERLDTAGITSYTVKTAGLDTVKVSFSEAAGSDHYDMISNYLTFNGTLALTTSEGEVATMDEFRTDKKAYVSSTDSIPQIVIPVDNTNPEFLAVIEAAKTQYEEAQENTGDDGEAETVNVYFWYDFDVDTDSYEAAQEDETIKDKILIPYDISQYNKDDDGNYPDEMVATISVDTNSDETASIAELQEGYYRANYYVNLLNAGELDYDVTYMYYTTVEPTTEYLIDLGNIHQYVAMSSTMIATIVSFVIVCAMLGVLYRLSAFAVSATSAVSVFGAIGLIVLTGAEINAATIVGLIIAALVSLASGIVYLTKLKEECYKGRTIKKANSEASKRSTLPIVDINVVAIIFGAMAFLIAGDTFKGLSAALVFGGLISLLLNTLALKGLMWMLTNTTALTGKYKYIGVNPKKVPNLVQEEKQTYFGSFADKDLTTKKKPVSIATLVLMVASLAGMITFGALGNGNYFNTRTDIKENSEIYFEAVNSEYIYSDTIVRNILADVKVYNESNPESSKALSEYIDGDILNPDSMSEKISEDGVVNEYIHYYYVVTLTSKFDDSTLAYLGDDLASLGEINDVLELALADNSIDNGTVSLKSVTNVTCDNPGSLYISLACLASMGIAMVYLMLRYRLSRGLTSLLASFTVSVISIGFFTLLRLSVSTYILAALPLVGISTLIASIYFMNKEREMVIEDKAKDNSVEHRNEIMIKANSQSYSMTMTYLIISLYMLIVFFGFGPSETATTYLFAILGLLIGVLIVSTLYGVVSQYFYKLLKNIKFEPRVKKSKKAKIKKSSAEPEEAIFIGIND